MKGRIGDTLRVLQIYREGKLVKTRKEPKMANNITSTGKTLWSLYTAARSTAGRLWDEMSVVYDIIPERVLSSIPLEKNAANFVLIVNMAISTMEREGESDALSALKARATLFEDRALSILSSLLPAIDLINRIDPESRPKPVDTGSCPDPRGWDANMERTLRALERESGKKKKG